MNADPRKPIILSLPTLNQVNWTSGYTNARCWVCLKDTRTHQRVGVHEQCSATVEADVCRKCWGATLAFMLKSHVHIGSRVESIRYRAPLSEFDHQWLQRDLRKMALEQVPAVFARGDFGRYDSVEFAAKRFDIQLCLVRKNNDQEVTL